MENKDGAVVSIPLAWKVGDAVPTQGDFCIMTGDMEAGETTNATVSTPVPGRITFYDSEKREVTVQTRFTEYTELVAKAAVTASELGYYVLDGNKVIPYASGTHSVHDIDGMIIGFAASADDKVKVIRG
jgi:hypothetical protein